MTTMKIVFECEDTPQNRISAENLFENIVERGHKDWDHDCSDLDECEECEKPIPIDERNTGKLPITRSLTDAYEMGKVDREIDVTDMYVEPEDRLS